MLGLLRRTKHPTCPHGRPSASMASWLCAECRVEHERTYIIGWKCANCGEPVLFALDPRWAGQWRWSGERWEHACGRETGGGPLFHHFGAIRETRDDPPSPEPRQEQPA